MKPCITLSNRILSSWSPPPFPQRFGLLWGTDSRSQAFISKSFLQHFFCLPQPLSCLCTSVLIFLHLLKILKMAWLGVKLLFFSGLPLLSYLLSLCHQSASGLWFLVRNHQLVWLGFLRLWQVIPPSLFSSEFQPVCQDNGFHCIHFLVETSAS